MPGKGSLSIDAVLARVSALSLPGCPSWPLIQGEKIFLGDRISFESGASKYLSGPDDEASRNILRAARQSDKR